MNARSLQEDLLSIPGVEGAEVEGTADKPAGLRIRIAEGADQAAVGGAIRRVLTAHGLGTDTRLPGEAPGEAAPAVVAEEPLVEAGDEAMGHATVEAEESPGAVAVMDMEDEPDAVIDLTEPHGGLDDVETPPPPVILSEAPHGEPEPPDEARVADDVVGSVPSKGNGSVARISSVAVEEGRGGITVTVTASDGSSVRQPAASNEGGVESAVIVAAAHMARPGAPEARVVDVDDRRIEGVDIVMIVLELNGEMVAGSAVVGAGRSFALGRATWAALTN